MPDFQGLLERFCLTSRRAREHCGPARRARSPVGGPSDADVPLLSRRGDPDPARRHGGPRHLRSCHRPGQERRRQRPGCRRGAVWVRDGDDPRRLRAVRGAGGERGAGQQELRRHGPEVRQQVDLRAAGGGHLLPDERCGTDVVRHQARRRPVRRAAGWPGLRRRPQELLRRLRHEWLRRPHDQYHLDDPPADLWRRPGQPGERGVRRHDPRHLSRERFRVRRSGRWLTLPMLHSAGRLLRRGAPVLRRLVAAGRRSACLRVLQSVRALRPAVGLRARLVSTRPLVLLGCGRPVRGHISSALPDRHGGRVLWRTRVPRLPGHGVLHCHRLLRFGRQPVCERRRVLHDALYRRRVRSVPGAGRGVCGRRRMLHLAVRRRGLRPLPQLGHALYRRGAVL